MLNNLTKKNITLNKGGFSILELMISIGIISIISLMFTNFVADIFTTSQFEVEQAIAVEDARDSIEVVKKELRGAIQSEQGSYNLLLIEDQDLIYFADIDNDSKAEKVRYYRDNTLLVRETTEPGLLNLYDGVLASTTIARYINNQEEDIFIYYDGSNNITTLINEVRLIGINLRINVTPEIAPNDYYVMSNVMLRNLKDNL